MDNRMRWYDIAFLVGLGFSGASSSSLFFSCLFEPIILFSFVLIYQNPDFLSSFSKHQHSGLHFVSILPSHVFPWVYFLPFFPLYSLTM